MRIFENAFEDYRTRFIVPMKDYGVQYNHLRVQNIKRALCDGKMTGVSTDNNDYLFYFDKDTILKALVGEIELFYIRAIMQKEDAKVISASHREISDNWIIVTSYYYTFFLSSFLLRLCYRGNIYFDNESKNKLSKLVSTIIGDVIVLPNNCIFQIEQKDSQYVCRLSSSGNNGTHEIVWKEVNKLLEDMYRKSLNPSDERTVLRCVLDINKLFGCTYPSELRNKINYRAIYGFEFLESNFHGISTANDNNWLNFILEFDSFANKNDDKMIKLLSSYCRYLETLAFNLWHSYILVYGRGNGILHRIQLKYQQQISIPDYTDIY